MPHFYDKIPLCKSSTFNSDILAASHKHTRMVGQTHIRSNTPTRSDMLPAPTQINTQKAPLHLALTGVT